MFVPPPSRAMAQGREIVVIFFIHLSPRRRSTISSPLPSPERRRRARQLNSPLPSPEIQNFIPSPLAGESQGEGETKQISPLPLRGMAFEVGLLRPGEGVGMIIVRAGRSATDRRRARRRGRPAFRPAWAGG